MNYIVPEYYKHFKCKCGDCRHSCCDEWPISISMKEYYRLVGIKCSVKLRTKLDCALKINPKPGNAGYTQIATDWRGNCMLHRQDGLCALQKELGENNLPEVCRLYPRSTKRINKIYECSCSNSCEAVVELLMNLQEPMQFEEKDLSLEPEFEMVMPPEKYECCKKAISIIQDRSLPLPERFISLGNYLYGTDTYSKRPDNRSLAFQLQHVFDQYFESSISIYDYCKASQSYFGIESNGRLSAEDLNTITDKYIYASEHLEEILPDWQILFEQLIVNHMFYNNFPYIDNQDKVNDTFPALVIMYSFLRFITLGYMSDKTDLEKLADFLAAMFRVIEHSNFYSIAVNLLKKENYPLHDCIPQLLYI